MILKNGWVHIWRTCRRPMVSDALRISATCCLGVVLRHRTQRLLNLSNTCLFEFSVNEGIVGCGRGGVSGCADARTDLGLYILNADKTRIAHRKDKMFSDIEAVLQSDISNELMLYHEQARIQVPK